MGRMDQVLCFYRATDVIFDAMNELIKALFSDSQVLGYSVHNWILVVVGVGIIWSFILIRDL
jgi:hypothetical protein